MNLGRVLILAMLALALAAGALIYWLQVYAYYRPVSFTPGREMVLTPADGGPPEAIAVRDIEGIDAESSPLRFRACFTMDASPTSMARFAPYDEPTPLIGPRWFSCYDAGAIGAALERGEARAFLSQRDIHPGVDRVVAVLPDGRAYAWHQLNGELGD